MKVTTGQYLLARRVTTSIAVPQKTSNVILKKEVVMCFYLSEFSTSELDERALAEAGGGGIVVGGDGGLMHLTGILPLLLGLGSGQDAVLHGPLLPRRHFKLLVFLSQQRLSRFDLSGWTVLMRTLRARVRF